MFRRVFLFLVVFLCCVGSVSQVVRAEDFVSTSDVRILINVVPDDWYDTHNVFNVSDVNQVTNLDIWENFSDETGVEGKLFDTMMLPSVMNLTYSNGVHYRENFAISNVFSLPSDFFMQGVQQMWVRMPFLFDDSIESVRVQIDCVHSFSKLVYTSSSINDSYIDIHGGFRVYNDSVVMGSVSDVFVRHNYTVLAKNSSYENRSMEFMYYRVDAPIYSDLFYHISFFVNFNTSFPAVDRRVSLLFNSDDLGVSDFFWTDLMVFSFSQLAHKTVDVCSGIGFLGVAGMNDGMGGWVVNYSAPYSSYPSVMFMSELPVTLNTGDNITFMFPLAERCSYNVSLRSSFSAVSEFYYQANVSNYIFISDAYTGVSSLDSIVVFIEFYDNSSFWLFDKNPPLIYFGVDDVGYGNCFFYSEGGVTTNVSWSPFFVLQVSDSGRWANVVVPPLYIISYTFVNYTAYPSVKEGKNVLSLRDIYEYGRDAYIRYVWSNMLRVGQVIYDNLPPGVKVQLARYEEWVEENVGSRIYHFSIVASEIEEIGVSIYHVGLEVFDWIIESIPLIRSILTLILRLSFILTIFAVFDLYISLWRKIFKFYNILCCAGGIFALDFMANTSPLDSFGGMFLLASISASRRVVVKTKETGGKVKRAGKKVVRVGKVVAKGTLGVIKLLMLA